MALVPNVRDMDDITLIKHMEARHREMIADGFSLDGWKLRAGVEWRTFHDKSHELYDGRTVGDGEQFFNHVHKEQGA